jgi:hypothetical protein
MYEDLNYTMGDIYHNGSRIVEEMLRRNDTEAER